MAEFRRWLLKAKAQIMKGSYLHGAIDCALDHWVGLTRFLDDGRLEIDSNTVERAMRPVVLTRKNSLFAGSDGGAENWAITASIIETCKLLSVNSQAYIADVLTKIVQGWPKQPYRRADALGLATASHSGAGRGVIHPGGQVLTLLWKATAYVLSANQKVKTERGPTISALLHSHLHWR